MKFFKTPRSNTHVDPIEGFKDILEEFDIKISEPQRWNFKPIKAPADVALPSDFRSYSQKIDRKRSRSNRFLLDKIIIWTCWKLPKTILSSLIQKMASNLVNFAVN